MRLSIRNAALASLAGGGVLALGLSTTSLGQLIPDPFQDPPGRTVVGDTGGFQVPNPAVVDGVAQLPDVVRAKIARINTAIHSCMRTNGAIRHDLPRGGFYYVDSVATKKGACESEIAASDRYAASVERRQAEMAILPVQEAMGRCAIDQGVPVSGEVEERVLNIALAECTAIVNRQFG